MLTQLGQISEEFIFLFVRKFLLILLPSQVTCHYHPQPNGHYAKSTFYAPTPVALTGAVVPTPIVQRPQAYHKADDVFENGLYPPNHMHTNLVVGDDGSYDEVDHDVMRVKLPPASAPSSGVDARPCRNASCEFYGTSEFSFFCSKCYSKMKKSNAAATSR